MDVGRISRCSEQHGPRCGGAAKPRERGGRNLPRAAMCTASLCRTGHSRRPQSISILAIAGSHLPTGGRGTRDFTCHDILTTPTSASRRCSTASRARGSWRRTPARTRYRCTHRRGRSVRACSTGLRLASFLHTRVSWFVSGGGRLTGPCRVHVGGTEGGRVGGRRREAVVHVEHGFWVYREGYIDVVGRGGWCAPFE